MKKILSIMLMIAMLLTSTVALAEGSMPVFAINIGDIQMFENDEMLMDLSGLNISLGAGFDETEGAALISGQVTAGEETALNAGIALADGKLVANVEGMTEPLTLDLAALLTEENIQMLVDEILAQFSEEELLALTQMYEAILEIASEDSLIAMEEAMAEYENGIEAILMENMTAEEGIAHAFITREGEMTADSVTIAITGENMAELMEMAFGIYDSNPAFLKLINAALMLDGEEPIDSFTELYDETEMAEVYAMMDMVITVNISGEYGESLMDVEVGIYDATAEEETLLADVCIGIDLIEEPLVILQVTDPESGEALYGEFGAAASEEFPGETEIFGYMGMIYDEDDQEDLMTLWVGPDADYGTLGNLIIGEAGDAVGIAWGYNETTQVLNIYDDYGTDIVFGMTTDFDGAEAGETMVYMEMTEYETTTSFSAVVSFSVEEVALDDVLTLAAMDGIDMMDITAEDEEQLSADMETIVMNTLLSLMQNVPGVATMLGMGE